MATDKEIRAQIDTETVRGLQVINGGAAAGLAAALPSILKIPEYRPLALSMILATICALIGLIASVIHNRLRRKCSLAHEAARADQNKAEPPYTNEWLVKLQSIPAEPKVCTRSVIWMWGSLSAFLIASLIVAIGAFWVLNRTPTPTDRCYELVQNQGKHEIFNACTGRFENEKAGVIKPK